MLNLKRKSYSGQSLLNRTDALCYVEVSKGRKRVFASTINDKKAETLIPIIFKNVAKNTNIRTDDHRSSSSYTKFLYRIMKLYITNISLPPNDVNTQTIEL